MFRVATYNVHDCIGRDGIYSPARIVEVISELDVDVIALQEVTLDHAGDVLARIEQVTAMKAIDGTLFERGVGRYGNVLLSRLPVIGQRLHDISWSGREPRGVVDARFETGGPACRMLATHLGLDWRERREQIGRLAELIRDDQGPVVLLGDFNILIGKLGFGQLRRVGMRATHVRSFPTWSVPLLALDRVLVREPSSLIRHWRHCSPSTTVASDHFPLVAELELAPEG